jgi:hypothetical protein
MEIRNRFISINVSFVIPTIIIYATIMTLQNALFNVAIATIFAREFLEGFVIVGNYRAVIQRNEDWDEETKKRALKTVTWSASMACVVGTYGSGS